MAASPNGSAPRVSAIIVNAFCSDTRSGAALRLIRTAGCAVMRETAKASDGATPAIVYVAWLIMTQDGRKAAEPGGEDPEVTPEMIEAGIDAMWGFELDGFDLENWRTAIRAGFCAMLAVRQKDPV